YLAASEDLAYFTVSNGESPKEDFVIALVDPATIAQARALVSGAGSKALMVTGTLVTEPVAYNKPWHFYLDPASVSFAQQATEVCTSSTTYLEAHLSEVGGSFLPKNHWCPWKSRIVSEIRR